MLKGAPGLSNKKSGHGWKRLMAGGFIAIVLLSLGGFWLVNSISRPREAPEAEKILNAQVGMPFQVLIPAYLPKVFDRESIQIITGQPGPKGEAMIRLIYPTRQGYLLTLSEWLPNSQLPDEAIWNNNGKELNIGTVRVKVEYSTPNLLSATEMQLMLETLGPAANRQTYSSIEDVPLSVSMPPAVEVPTGFDGVQEFMLVVTPEGYSPVHFAVKKDVPVRLVFRQLGEVGCGNELFIQWGTWKSATLTLTSPNDKQILEFTPGQSGEFPFNCLHQHYRGLMTVKD